MSVFTSLRSLTFMYIFRNISFSRFQNPQLATPATLATHDLELSTRNSTTRKLPSPFLNLVQFLILAPKLMFAISFNAGNLAQDHVNKIKVPLQDLIVTKYITPQVCTYKVEVKAVSSQAV